MTIDSLIPPTRDPQADPRLGDTFRLDGAETSIDAWGRRREARELERTPSGRVVSRWKVLQPRRAGQERHPAATHVRLRMAFYGRQPFDGGKTKWVPVDDLGGLLAAGVAPYEEGRCWWSHYRDRYGAIDAYRPLGDEPETIVMPWGVLVHESGVWRAKLKFRSGDIKTRSFRLFGEACAFASALVLVSEDREIHRILAPGYHK